MPKLTIGLCHKVVPANSSSHETIVSIELEADSSLVSEPGKLQQRIRQLLAVLRSSLAEDLNGNASSDSSQPELGNQPKNRWSVDRLATPSQVKAIYAITQAKRLNLVQILQDRFK